MLAKEKGLVKGVSHASFTTVDKDLHESHSVIVGVAAEDKGSAVDSFGRFHAKLTTNTDQLINIAKHNADYLRPHIIL